MLPGESHMHRRLHPDQKYRDCPSHLCKQQGFVPQSEIIGLIELLYAAVFETNRGWAHGLGKELPSGSVHHSLFNLPALLRTD